MPSSRPGRWTRRPTGEIPRTAAITASATCSRSSWSSQTATRCATSSRAPTRRTWADTGRAGARRRRSPGLSRRSSTPGWTRRWCAPSQGSWDCRLRTSPPQHALHPGVRAVGAKQVRVRHHGELARIEVEEVDYGKVAARRGQISQALRGLGWSFVTLDLRPYRTGGTRS